MDSLCCSFICGSFVRRLIIVCIMASCNVLASVEIDRGAQIEDASDVTWAHAVNSRDELEKALASSVNFLEADISLGHIKGSENTPFIPVMAHPPSKISDISLDDWVNIVATRGSDKGLKLDFKSTEVVEPSLKILQKYALQLNGFLWLSADVLSGPVRSRITPVQADTFLLLCNRYFPDASLSLGWTTQWTRRLPVSSWKYEWGHVRQMADIVRCRFGDSYPPITFSVRGMFASRSIRQLQWLLDAIPHSTLTVWNANMDNVNEEDVTAIGKAFGKEKVYYDRPGVPFKPLNKDKDSIIHKKKNILDDKWLAIIRERENTCESYTYRQNNEIMFGKSFNTLVLQRTLLLVNDNNNLTITGRLKFFAGEHIINPTHWDHKLKIVLADVNDFAKNVISYSKKKLSFSIRDTEALWQAINSSFLYNFDHPYFIDSSACRMFKLDVNANLTFDAWTIPCDETYENTPFEELCESSISEVSLEEGLDNTEKVYMIGFYSYGEEYVLVHDLNINGQDETNKPVLVLAKQQLALTSSKNVLIPNFIMLLLLILVSIFMR